MAIDLQNPTNIDTGWKPPVEFKGVPIAGVLGEILQQRRAQQALVAAAIKDYQKGRQQDAYTAALQEAGLTGGQDISGVGSAEATALSRQIMAQKVADARAGEINAHTAYYNAKAANPYAPSRGGGGGGGGSGQPGGAGGPEFVYDADGTKYLVVRTSKSTTYHRVPNQSGGGAAPKLSPTERGWAAPEIPGVSVNINAPDEPGKLLPPDTAAMPEPAPAETGDTIQTSKVQPTTGGGASTDIIRIRAEAQDAIARGADPEAVKRRFHDQTGGVL